MVCPAMVKLSMFTLIQSSYDDAANFCDAWTHEHTKESDISVLLFVVANMMDTTTVEQEEIYLW